MAWIQPSICTLAKPCLAANSRKAGWAAAFKKAVWEAVDEHFHESIGKVIDLAGAKRIDDAKMEMRSGDFKKFSSEVVLCISKIKTVVHFKNEKH